MDYKSWIEPRMRELRSETEIIFALDCSCCGQSYRTYPYHVDKSVELTKEAQANAHQQAIADFSDILTRCPYCERFVCGRCVVVDERGHLCKDCAQKLPGGEQCGVL